MASTKREDVIRALMTRLATITTGNGYAHTLKVCSRVFRAPSEVSDGERPAVVLGVGFQARAENPHATTKHVIRMDVPVYCYPSTRGAANDNTAQDDAHALMQDVARAVAANCQLQGNVIEARCTATTINDGQENTELRGLGEVIVSISYEAGFGEI